MHLNKLLMAGVAAAALVVGTAHAGPAWEFTTPGTNFTNGSWDFGNDFTVSSTVTATGLGYYADPVTGNADSNSVALYDGNGNLLASAVVTNVYPELGHFRYVTIAPVTLNPGQTYQVDGVSNADNYTWNDSNFLTDPAVTYVGNIWYQNPTGPTYQGGALINDVADGYWGPNVFLGTPVFATPEPASLAVLGAGLAGLGMLRRRRR